MMTSPVICQYRSIIRVATDIWQEKSSSSYPDNVSMLNYDRRSHHPATRIMFLYWHMTGSWMMTSPVICQYRSIIRVAGWRLLLSYGSISYPDNVSMLNYDRRNHHPATQIMFLYYHMTGEVIIQLPGYCHMTGEVHYSGSWMMTSPVIIQYRNIFQVAEW
jgi:hypothetical protein